MALLKRAGFEVRTPGSFADYELPAIRGEGEESTKHFNAGVLIVSSDVNSAT